MAGLSALIFIPILITLGSGRLFGADWSEYLFTASIYRSHSSSLFAYPSPALPILYAPLDAAVTNEYDQACIAEVISGITALGVFLAAYLCCRSISGSRWAGLAGALALAAFPLLLYEVAWGGQAQLLSYALGLLALWILVDRVLPDCRWSWAGIAGVLLSAATFADLYAAGFLVLTAVSFLVLVLRARIASARGAVVALSAAGPPLVTGLVQYWIQPSTAAPTGAVTIAGSVGVLSMYQGLWQTVTFGVAALGVAYAVAAGAYFVQRIAYRSPSPTAPTLVAASALAALTVGALLTPLDVSGRTLYPLAFPFGIAVADSVAWLAPDGPPPRTPIRWIERRRFLRPIGPTCAVVLLLATSVQLGVVLQAYPASVANQSYPAGELTELFWLSHEPGAILYDSTPVDHFFPVLWATGRPVYPGPAFQPYTVTSTPKQATAIVGTSLSYGEEWVNAGPFIVTGDEPAWGQPDPGIVLNERSTLLLSLEGNDFADTVGYSPSGQPNLTAKTTLFHADSYSVSLDPRGWTETFGYDGFSLAKSIVVAPTGTLYWNYSFHFVSATPRFVQLYVTAPDRTRSSEALLATNSTGSNATVVQTFAFGNLAPITQRFAIASQAENATQGTTLIPRNVYGIFQLEYDLAPATNATRNLGLSIAIGVMGVRASTPTVTNESTVLQTTGIRWVVLMKSVGSILLQRFFDDPIFVAARTTAHYYILTLR